MGNKGVQQGTWGFINEYLITENIIPATVKEPTAPAKRKRIITTIPLILLK